MHPKSNRNFNFLAIFITSIHFPVFFGQNNPCIKPFQCGSIKNISYPFWGGSRPLSCGYPGFELTCHGGDSVPLLNISSLSYRVLQMDFSTHTLKVARQDLWNNTCPSVLRNTTLDPNLFEFAPDSNDKHVTLFFDCSYDNNHNNQSQQQTPPPSQFSCHVNGVETINLFNTGDVYSSANPGSGIICRHNISVLVNQTADRALQDPRTSSIKVLQAALAGGFSIKWLADNANSQESLKGGAAPPTPVTHDESQGSSQNPGDSSAPAAIIVGRAVGVTAGLIMLSIVIAYYLQRRCSSFWLDQGSDQDLEKFILQHGSLAPKRYSYSEIKKITRSFTDKLGQGGYGTVYKGMLPDGCLIAVKVLTETNSNGEEFINEVASISRTSHVNIVNLLGFCYEGKKRALVYEFMPNKSLDKFISNTRSPDIDCHLDCEQLYKISTGVAKGLEYLHAGCNTRIVHFDIKPQNILLDQDFWPKISDFGLAKLCKKKQSISSMLGTRGTIGYIAPEVFSRNFGRVSHKSDVYSYGMMILEMIGARKTIETKTIQSSDNYFPDQIYNHAILDLARKLDDSMIEGEEERVTKMFLVGFWCIQTTPSDRPSMSKVIEMLEGSIQSIPIPPKPTLFCHNTLSKRKISPSLSASAATDTTDDAIM